MNHTDSYSNWKRIKAKNLLSENLTNDTIVWFRDLCPNKTNEPYNCRHKVAITITKFRSDYSSYDGICYYTENLSEERIALLNYKTALISIMVALITLLITIKQCGDEVVSSNGIIKNEQCDCETEDIVVGKGKEKIRFKVVYLSQEKRWEFASNSKLTNGQDIESFLQSYLPRIPNFETSIGLISVGLASQEGELKEEEIRAGERADAILSSFRVLNFSSSKELYKLNLGQYRNGKKKDVDKKKTAHQRRVILIGIMEKEENMSTKKISAKLKAALEDSERLNFDTRIYSQYEFGKY